MVKAYVQESRKGYTCHVCRKAIMPFTDYLRVNRNWGSGDSKYTIHIECRGTWATFPEVEEQNIEGVNFE